MDFIAHRINLIEELKQLPSSYGAELDLRDDLNGRIYIQHNPFEQGEDFEDYLKEYHHGIMILNIKSERIEPKVLELLRQYNISNYFFLDSSFPMIYAMSKAGEKNIALRVSEFEGLDTPRNMAGKVSWIWVDCFAGIPIGKEECEELRNFGYRLCLVSPELEGQDDIERYKRKMKEEGLSFDAVCTKKYNIERWKIDIF